MTTDPSPLLGVLGGMGPAATADFLLRLARLTPARRDQDHLPTIVYSNPQTPDRSDAILGTGPSPLPALRRGVEFLQRAGCGLIAIPCNSAHFWYDELAAESRVPILHIVDAVAAAVRARGATGPVGVLATDGTIRSGIYQARLGAVGLAALVGDDPASPAMRGIRLMKAGEPDAARAQLTQAGAGLVAQGASALVVGCTDLSAALAGATELAGVPVVDAAECLASACVERLTAPPELAPA